MRTVGRIGRGAIGLAIAGAIATALSGCVSMDTAEDARDDAAETTIASEVVGTWKAEEAGDVAAELTFESGGALTGSDGCNTLTGRWEADDTRIEFDDVAITQKECIGMEPWLGRLDEATLSADTLTIFDDSETQIGTLNRS
ncbi:META domain-containing protein [Leucobacter chromiiresistens]|uniref:META domain-containing protein n=1 Tax=Leucobacter chromiiresistens TaxID=1079994 RepID=A0A1H1A1V8_9MICO|nr:META domain-containing protein [Leucobacter chromiiresistens]SDQ33639.1 META domain-containing protein [Leucobacter chromiiresistens]